ncbi:hypothetical protein GRI58_07905 [Porphyrobacter algicida]|uniref:Uncharacterized protein n=1 Tax=Qipengyuania algicida TaxID=1836209 RepID=A0A845AHT7_9SPHN|nr:hypothetical protein [Qipengyuania algicida]MXP28743.1 hypothetical protein [Qipengyuania algicida]
MTALPEIVADLLVAACVLLTTIRDFPTLWLKCQNVSLVVEQAGKRP